MTFKDLYYYKFKKCCSQTHLFEVLPTPIARITTDDPDENGISDWCLEYLKPDGSLVPDGNPFTIEIKDFFSESLTIRKGKSVKTKEYNFFYVL